MFREGEYVVYGTNGVCRVGEITKLNFKNIPKDIEYYVLYPKNNGCKIYVPVDKAKPKMRNIISKEEAEKSLYWELGTALDIPKEQVLDYIIKEIEKSSS